MITPLSCGTYKADNANLTGSEFHKVNLSGSKYNDVNLRDTVFENVAFTRATIRNACMGDVSIEDASYAGMRIEGILVTELLRVYRETKPTGKQVPNPQAQPTADGTISSAARPTPRVGGG
ncbi:MAG: pentapeptide repeat-containing protein [Limisphaerales bacterium]